MNFDIKKEDLLELAVKRIVEDYHDQDGLDWIGKYAKDQIKKLIDTKVTDAVDTALNNLLPELINSKITPRDIWGDTIGEETTVKEQLHKKALKYWDERVDEYGKITSSSYGRTRAQFLLQNMVNTEFTKIMSENLSVVINSFKDNLKKDLSTRADILIKEAFKNN